MPVRRGLVLALLATALSGPAVAQEVPHFSTPNGHSIVVGGSTSDEQSGHTPTPSRPAGPGEPTHPVVVLRNDAGGVCLDLALRAGAASAAGQRELELQIVDLMRSYRWCEGAS